MVVLELGLGDEDLRLRLEPGEALELPEILIQPLPGGEPHLNAHRFQAYTLENLFQARQITPPVIYNTWFDRFDHLDRDRLQRQVEAARQVGCEAFVVDAGWFGPDTIGWSQAVGDWREKTGAAFYGKLSEFARQVRQAGLGFGLWMEPERFHRSVPICLLHPEWFIRIPATDMCRIDLEQAEAYGYLKGEICRLIDRYELAWMKVDFNFDFGWDATGAEMLPYYQNWYRLIDEIHQKYPGTFIEGCSSGGLRSDLTALRHFDGHFLSDTVNPVDMLRITQGALLRMPPGKITRWAVVRGAGDLTPGTASPENPPQADRLIGPRQADWGQFQNLDLDFAVLAAFPGILGLSGDLAGLPVAVKQRLKAWVEIYKQYRSFILSSTARLFEPPQSLENRNGWIRFQLEQPGSRESLLLAYRLLRSSPSKLFRLRGLDPHQAYLVRRLNPDQEQSWLQSGAQLLEEGLRVHLPDVHRAAGFAIQPVSP
jgi:alpha-galactosidase